MDMVEVAFILLFLLLVILSIANWLDRQVLRHKIEFLEVYVDYFRDIKKFNDEKMKDLDSRLTVLEDEIF